MALRDKDENLQIRSNMGVEESKVVVACFSLEVAQRMGYDHVVLEGDALNVINTIRKKERGITPITCCTTSYMI